MSTIKDVTAPLTQGSHGLPAVSDERRCDWRSARSLPRDVRRESSSRPRSVRTDVPEAQVAVAKAVCAGCAVRSECVEEALVRIPDGIAGGLTPEERRGLRSAVAHESTVIVETGLRAGARRGEREAAGRVLLAAGRPIREVAYRCGVGERTAARWAARARAMNTTSAAEGSLRSHRAPPPDLPHAQPPARDSNAGRTPRVMNAHDERPRTLRSAEAASAAWSETVEHQQDAPPRHADFYAVAAEIVATLYALDDLTVVLAAQVGGYGQGRILYDDTLKGGSGRPPGRGGAGPPRPYGQRWDRRRLRRTCSGRRSATSASRRRREQPHP